MGFDELERRIKELHGAPAAGSGARGKIVLVVVLCAAMVVVLALVVIGAIGEAARQPQAALPAVVVSPAADAAPPLAPDVEAKLAAYRAFLAEVDGTLHAVRLERPDTYEAYLSWKWPVWLPAEQLAVRLDELVVLARAAPAMPALDGLAALYVETVRAELPAWTAAIAAWPRGAEAYVAASATIGESFERFGAHSLALRDAMPPERAADARTAAHVAQVCFAGVELMARAAVPPMIGAVDVEQVERGSVYTRLAPGAARAVGLRCARAALDHLEQLEHTSDFDAPQNAVRMGLTLVTEEARQARYGAYITSLGNYAQLVAYAVRAGR